MACGGGVPWGSHNAMVRETCGRVTGGDVFLVFLGLAVMQCVGARLFQGLGAHVGTWIFYVCIAWCNNSGAACPEGATVQQQLG